MTAYRMFSASKNRANFRSTSSNCTASCHHDRKVASSSLVAPVGVKKRLPSCRVAELPIAGNLETGQPGNASITPRAQSRIDDVLDPVREEDRCRECGNVDVRLWSPSAIDKLRIELRRDFLPHLEAADSNRRPEVGGRGRWIEAHRRQGGSRDVLQ